MSLLAKLDGTGLVDNRPSTDYLHLFVKTNKKQWHLTPDTWHMTHDMWHMVRDEHYLKSSAPQLSWFGIDIEDLEQKDDSLN